MGRRVKDDGKKLRILAGTFRSTVFPPILAGLIMLLLFLFMFTGCDQNPLIDDLKTILDSEGKKVADPAFSVKGGDYYEQENIELELICNTDGAEIRYTTDGSEPGPEKGEKYNDGDTIALSESMTVKAVAYKKYWDSSDIVKEKYSITVMPDGFDYVLDTSFGNDGVVVYDVSNDTAGYGLTIDSNGKIIVAGQIENTTFDAIVWRYTDTGTLDTTFNNAGTLPGIKTYDSGNDEGLSAVTIDNSNNVIVAGSTGPLWDRNTLLIRFTESGALDSTFDGDGILTVALSEGQFCSGVALDGFGRIVCSGYQKIDNPDPHTDVMIWKVESDGTAYTAGDFDTNGIITYDLNGLEDYESASCIGITSSNDIVCAGEAQNECGLWWYSEEGVPRDTGDFTNGFLSFGGEDAIESSDVIFDSNGNLFLVGSSFSAPDPDAAIWARQSNGSSLTSFGNNGSVVFTDLGWTSGAAIAIDGEDNIYITGDVDSIGMTIWKYKPNGELDSGYQSDGYLSYDLSGSGSGQDIILDSQNRIVVAGYADGNMMLWRYKPRD